MTRQVSFINRRSFLKSSALAGGGLLISFGWLSAFEGAGETGAAVQGLKKAPMPPLRNSIC